MQVQTQSYLAREGDVALLLGNDGKRFIFRLAADERIQTHRGILEHRALIGLPYGSAVHSHLNYPFYLLTPSTDDLIRELRRTSQIIFPKDLGYILLKLAIRPGCTVIEAGTGSGGLTLGLAQAVMPTGRVISYDVRHDMQNLARKNLAFAGLSDYVTFKLRDIADGFEERDVDALFLDLPNPWDYVAQAHAALKSGGFFGTLVPTANQVIEVLSALARQPFIAVEVEELILRPYKPVAARLRPMDRIVGHTGYLIFARTLTARVGGERETGRGPGVRDESEDGMDADKEAEE
jgi:tRNA (adenine57-N1/adenine58-N1)-methyltransferase